MLAPRASQAFVCVRCELQLARRRLPTYIRPSNHANFSQSIRTLDDGASELQALSEGHEPPKLKITREIAPLDRVRKRKGKVIRETSTRLGGLKRLGDDAEILVLKEVGGNAPKEHFNAQEPAEPLEVPDIIATLQQEGKELTPEEIQDRLESLRPRSYADAADPQYVTQTVFVRLIRVLMNGFTQPQLSNYYSAVKNIKQGRVAKEILADLKVEAKESKSFIARSQWQPGTTPLNRRLPGHVSRSSRPKRKPVAKQLLVDRILRDIWKLVPQEEAEAPGEIEIQLEPWQLTILNVGGSSYSSH